MSLIRFERNILAVRLQAMYKPDYNKGKKLAINPSERRKRQIKRDVVAYSINQILLG